MTGYPEGSWVETPYPLTEEQAHGPRESWPWLSGWVSEVCGPNEWLITVQVPELATLEDGAPAPEGTPEEEAFYPGCFRDSLEIRPAASSEPEPQRDPGLGHDYDGPELHPGTPEYAAGYAEYRAAEAQTEGPQLPGPTDLDAATVATATAIADPTVTTAEVERLAAAEEAIYWACPDYPSLYDPEAEAEAEL